MLSGSSDCGLFTIACATGVSFGLLPGMFLSLVTDSDRDTDGGLVEDVDSGLVDDVESGLVEDVDGGLVDDVESGLVEDVDGGLVDDVDGGLVEDVALWRMWMVVRGRCG